MNPSGPDYRLYAIACRKRLVSCGYGPVGDMLGKRKDPDGHGAFDWLVFACRDGLAVGVRRDPLLGWQIRNFSEASGSVPETRTRPAPSSRRSPARRA